MSEVLDSLWVEKYRPKNIDELALSEEYKSTFDQMIEKQQIPNLLFYGPPGGGKTTLARIICSPSGVLQHPHDNLLLVNGSARKSRGIGYVDEVIEPFLKNPPVMDKYRIVFIDEADKLTADGFDSLRAIIEKYQVTYCRFIFTCNYISKIPDPIQSRFMTFQFEKIPMNFVVDYTVSVLDREGVKYSKSDVEFLVENLYPDVRRIITTVQRLSMSGKLMVNKQDVITAEKQAVTYVCNMIDALNQNKDSMLGAIVGRIAELVSSNQMEYRNIYTDLFFNNRIPASAKIVVNKYANSHQSALVPHMHFMGMLFEIIKNIKEYKTITRS